jgi:hypothetical protein
VCVRAALLLSTVAAASLCVWEQPLGFCCSRGLLALDVGTVVALLDLLCIPFVLATRVSASSLAFVGWVSVYEQQTL